MNAAEPPRLVILSPTEMTGGWLGEVHRKLVEQGVDPQSAARIAGFAEDEMVRLATEREAARRPSI